MTKSAEAFRTISEVADWLGIPAHVLRFWESKFTQVKPVKRAGGRRYYRPADMQLLGGIRKLLHDDGMTIKGVQKIMRDHGVRHVAAMSPPLDADLASDLVADRPEEDAAIDLDVPEDTEAPRGEVVTFGRNGPAPSGPSKTTRDGAPQEPAGADQEADVPSAPSDAVQEAAETEAAAADAASPPPDSASDTTAAPGDPTPVDEQESPEAAPAPKETRPTPEASESMESASTPDAPTAPEAASSPRPDAEEASGSADAAQVTENTRVEAGDTATEDSAPASDATPEGREESGIATDGSDAEMEKPGTTGAQSQNRAVAPEDITTPEDPPDDMDAPATPLAALAAMTGPGEHGTQYADIAARLADLRSRMAAPRG